MSDIRTEIDGLLDLAGVRDPAERAALHGKIEGRLHPLHDGRVVVIEQDRSPAIHTADGRPWTIAELVSDVVGKTTLAPAAAEPNPWAKATRNFTRQAQLTKSDPALAARFRKDAGR